jgi:NADH:ubiquinone oxidoreductase subunit 3 (subunit A)
MKMDLELLAFVLVVFFLVGLTFGMGFEVSEAVLRWALE